jgi:Na+-translocating ferredoxin:NAD+ oxidoreductase RnfG subunit
MRFRKGVVALITIGTILAAPVAHTKVVSRKEVLQSAFPDAQVRQTMIFLTDQERKEASHLSGQEIESALVARYTAKKNGEEIGRAYLDTGLVRTKKQSILVLLNPDGSVKRVEVVAFLEPPEYMASDRWYRQFEGKTLTSDLHLNGSIHPITGATLTARATTDAVRRVLAIDQVLSQKKQAKP